jgi:hypothetical protein
MPSSEMLDNVALVRTDVSEECIASVIRVTRIGDLGIALAVISNRCGLLFVFTAKLFLTCKFLSP